MKSQSDIDPSLKEGMKTKDLVKTNVCRQLKNAIMTAAILSGNINKDISPRDFFTIVRKQIAMRRDSIVHFINGKREDLADNERAEIEILKEFIPDELEEHEIDCLVAQAIKDVSAVTKKDMGRAIGRAVELAEGNIEGRVLSSKIGALLV